MIERRETTVLSFENEYSRKMGSATSPMFVIARVISEALLLGEMERGYAHNALAEH
jgi:hypothetical protein